MQWKGWKTAMKNKIWTMFASMSKKRKIIAGAVTLVVLIALTSAISGGAGNQMEGMALQKIDYEEKIVAAGLLQLAQETSLTAEVSGVVDAVLAKDGDILTAGSILIHIDDQDQSFQTEERKASYLDAESQYRQIVEIDYRAAKSELSRLTSLKSKALKANNDAKSLFQEGAISQTAMNDAQLNYEMVQTQWDAANLKVQSLSEGGALRNSALSRLEGAKATYQRAEDVSDSFHITVPWDSVVLKTYVEPQDYVQAGQVIADVGQQGGFYVNAELDEKYFPYLTKGMPAMISIGQDKIGEIEGKIDVITPKINEETGTFEVKVSLPSSFPYQASDLTVNIEIILQSVPDALIVPTDYLVQDTGKKDGAYVYLYQGGKVVLTEITVNQGSSEKAIVEKGLSPGDVIVKPVPGLMDGDKVKVSEGA